MELPKKWPYGRRSMWIAAQEKQVARYFAKRNIRTTGRGFILADDKAWQFNLVQPRLKEWIERIQGVKQSHSTPFALHKYLYHGLSSQALLINLLGPLIVDRRWETFDRILKDASLSLNGKVNDVDLEYTNRSIFNEDRGQPTSFDLACETNIGEKILVEFKFTEKEFGGCSVFSQGDCDGQNPANDHSQCYLDFLGRTYWDKMKKHQLDESVKRDTICPFTYFYQAYRELLFALESGGKYLLIYDSRNSAFVSEGPVRRGLWVRFLSNLPEAIRASVFSITIQQIADLLEEAGCSWISDLREKHDLQRASAVPK